MLGHELLQHYRRMTPRERIAEMRELIEVAERALGVLAPQEVRRRFEAADRIREASKRALLERLARLDEGRAAAAGQ
ncbi:MAG: hypothetical protein KatS3mg102_0554 [Planctomycetota bacterium]|nr:MAG: hypothetical protein KatS3mg102_0554 [Planctomycetota bacterium]